MTTSLDALSSHDVSEIFRLIGELRELGREPLAWRTHMMQTLRRLSGSRVVLDAETRHTVTGPQDFYEAADLGYDDAERDECMGYFYKPNPVLFDPTWIGLAKYCSGNYTLQRHAFVPNPVWEHSTYVNDVRRRYGLEDLIVSSRVIPLWRCNHMLAWHRTRGDAPFNERDRQLLALFHDELLHSVTAMGPNKEAAETLAHLSPALRDTLSALLLGDSEKQAADRLRIGNSALHDRIKRLHRSFKAHSRGELLSKVGPVWFSQRPRLEVEITRHTAVRWYRIPVA